MTKESGSKACDQTSLEGGLENNHTLPSSRTTKIFASELNTSRNEKCTACSICRKVFTKVSNLNRHEKVSHKGMRYLCDRCDHMFTCKSALKRHMRITHEGLRCDVCYSIFVSPEQMVVHSCLGKRVDTKTAQCSECGKSFSCLSNLNKHRRVTHLGITYPCSVCAKRLRSQESVVEHCRTAHGVYAFTKCGENEESFVFPFLKGKSTQPVCCGHCSKFFSSSSNLTKHIRVVHNNERWSCGQCDQRFTCNALLLRHQQTVHSQQTYRY